MAMFTSPNGVFKSTDIRTEISEARKPVLCGRTRPLSREIRTFPPDEAHGSRHGVQKSDSILVGVRNGWKNNRCDAGTREPHAVAQCAAS